MNDRKNVYLDHNATTPLKPGVRDAMLEILGFPGNPSSVHKAGRDSRRRIEAARAEVLRFVNAGERAVLVFTSGATEANNLVLKGAGAERILASAIEHVSVLGAAPHESIPVTADGLIDLGALDKMLSGTDRSTLVSVMLVNNETGVIQPVAGVMALAKKHGALVHVDAAQAAGRITIDLQALGVDYLTLSAHKMGGPQGAGCLILANCVTVSPQLVGGNQEKNMRAGTENVAAIAGFGKAAELAAVDMPAYQKLALLRDRMEEALLKAAPELNIFGRNGPRVANTSMFALRGASSETQLIALDLAGIAVSNGSACSSGTVKPSHVLLAMGASPGDIGSSLRVSMGWNTTQADIDYFIEKWTETVARVKTRTHA